MKWLVLLGLLGCCSQLQTLAQSSMVGNVEAQCGAWQGQYTQLHSAMRAGTRPMRRLISVPVYSGFADRMVGSITAMLFALLTDRAIFFESQTANGAGRALRPLTDAFAMDTINWADFQTTPEVMAFLNSKSPANEDADAIKQYSFGAINESTKEYHIAMVNGWGQEHLYNTVMNQSEGFETVYMVLNRGMTVSIFDNAVVKARVEALGLQPRYTFACLYKYLFVPNREVFSRFPAELSALSDPFALKIGVQIRTGDLANLADPANRTAIDLYRAFFDCAQQIEDTRIKPGQRVIWYFLSDSLNLRQAVSSVFGNKVLVKTTGIDTSHSAKETRRQGRGRVSLSTYQSIAGEHWLFSMTDFQVVSFDSGIGRSAAFLGGHSIDTIYTINKWWDADPPGFGLPRQCGIADADNYKGVAATWSLI